MKECVRERERGRRGGGGGFLPTTNAINAVFVDGNNLLNRMSIDLACAWMIKLTQMKVSTVLSVLPLFVRERMTAN